MIDFGLGHKKNKMSHSIDRPSEFLYLNYNFRANIIKK